MAIKKSIIELIRKTKEYIIEKYNYVVIKVDTDFIGCMYENDNYFIFFISENQGGKFIFNYREDFTRKDSTKKDITNMQFEEVKKLIDKYMIKADHLNNLLIYPRKKLKYSKIISDSNQNDSTYGLYENIKINDINISTRLKNVLISKNIDNLKKFMELEEKEIMSFKNVGAATIDEFINIKKKLNINPNDFTKIMIKKDINKKDILEKFEKELDQSKINILFGNLSLEKYGFKNKTVSDLKGIGIKNISDVVLKPYNEIKTSQNITKSCKDKILEIKLDFYKKLDFSDDTSDFLLTVIENIGYKTMTLPFLKNLLILNSDYPVRKLSDDISILKKKDKITYNTDGVCLKREKLLDYIDKNLKDNEKEIILYRLSGKTLQEIGDEFGLTKERIRQKVKKILSTIEYVEEDKFKNLFTEYNFSLEDFKKIFNENDQTFFYLKEKYENGKKLIAAGINDIRFNDNQINTITEICNLTIINGNVIELSKQGIIKDLIKRYAKKTIKIEEFVEKYNKFVIEHSELNLEKVNLRSMEGYLDRSNNVIFSIEKNFRFYDYDNIDEQYINQVKDLYNIEKGYYSSMVLFANNRSLMKNIDIHDEYELHSFSKRFLSLSEDVKFDRNPCFSIGNVTKKDFIQEKIIELSPISTSDFLQNIENDYGHKKSTLMAYLLQEFKELICNNQIDYNIESLSIDEVQNLKQIFCEPIGLGGKFQTEYLVQSVLIKDGAHIQSVMPFGQEAVRMGDQLDFTHRHLFHQIPQAPGVVIVPVAEYQMGHIQQGNLHGGSILHKGLAISRIEEQPHPLIFHPVTQARLAPKIAVDIGVVVHQNRQFHLPSSM